MDNEILEQPNITDGQGKGILQIENEGSKNDDNGSKLGKFKDAISLLNAYNNLQSDYTKKCQSLAALQKTLNDNEEKSSPKELVEQEENSLTKEDKEKRILEYILSNQALKDKVVANYIDNLNLSPTPKLIGVDRGSNVLVSPQSKPKTLEEAERIVKELFTSNK